MVEKKSKIGRTPKRVPHSTSLLSIEIMQQQHAHAREKLSDIIKKLVAENRAQANKIAVKDERISKLVRKYNTKYQSYRRLLMYVSPYFLLLELNLITLIDVYMQYNHMEIHTALLVCCPL